jgi:preprotein translocase subunit SecD
MPSLLTTINDRLGRAGRASELGNDQIKVELYGDLTPAELKAIKLRISAVGQLEFRIAANPSWPGDMPVIALAKQLAENEKQVVAEGNTVAEWVPYSEAEFGAVDREDNRVVKRLAGNVPEALVLIDALNVTGDYLTSAEEGVDARGGPAINFTFDSRGAALFRQLTGANTPDPATGAVRYLAIMLDHRILSAPSIRATIGEQGQISGGAMTKNEVDAIIAVLHAGRLPNPIIEVAQP